MGIKFGGIDSEQILINEFRIGVLESIIQWILENNPEIKKPDKSDIKEIKESAATVLKIKYPDLGIEFKES